jgi:hypothetical protein
MALFKPWTWFSSEERQLRLVNLNLEKKERELKIKLLEKQLNQQSEEQLSTSTKVSDKPYRSLRLIGDTCIVVMHDGTVLTKEGDKDAILYNRIKWATDEKEIYLLFAPSVVEEEKKGLEIETEEERSIIENVKGILEAHEDFEVTADNIYLKGVKLNMPASVSGSFIEILEKLQTSESLEEMGKLQEQYESLKMFWYWTALNPIQSSREALLNFIRREDVKITRNGLLEMYRRVVTNTHKDTALIDAISNNYYQIKKWKKAPSNHVLAQDLSNKYVCLHKDKVPADFSVVGNLQELYNDLPNMQENSYTDDRTRKMTIKVGSVYQEDESKIDLNNLATCSSGLHVGSRSFGFSGFGDTGVLALVNPAKVRSVPYYESNKMRVSEMYIAAILPEDDFRKSVDEEDIADYSQEYFNFSVEQLEEALEDKTFEEQWTVQGNKPALVEKEVENIKDVLASKVVIF